MKLYKAEWLEKGHGTDEAYLQANNIKEARLIANTKLAHKKPLLVSYLKQISRSDPYGLPKLIN